MEGTSFVVLSCLFLSPQSAVGLFNSKVKSHLLLFANRGSKDFTELKDRLRALAPEFTGKVGTSKPTSPTRELFQVHLLACLYLTECLNEGEYIMSWSNIHWGEYKYWSCLPVPVRADEWSTEVQPPVPGILWPQVQASPSSRYLWRWLRHEVASTWGRDFYRACAGLLPVLPKWGAKGEQPVSDDNRIYYQQQLSTLIWFSCRLNVLLPSSLWS